MFAMLRRSILGLLIASAIGVALCAAFLAASFVGLSLPHSAWAVGWLPVQVETDVSGTPRRKVARFSSLERAVAKAGPGDTVTVLSSVDVTEPISVDKDLSVVIAQGCDLHSSVGEGQPVFVVEPACRSFQLTADHASRMLFDSPRSSGLLAVSPAPLAASIAVRGISVHDTSLAAGAALFDLGGRPVAFSLEDSDVFNLNAPVVRTRDAARADITIAASRLERIKGDAVIDLLTSPAATLLVADSVLVGSLGCDLVRMARPSLILCGNSYLSALGAQTLVCAGPAAQSASASFGRVVA